MFNLYISRYRPATLFCRVSPKSVLVKQQEHSLTHILQRDYGLKAHLSVSDSCRFMVAFDAYLDGCTLQLPIAANPVVLWVP